MAAVSLFPLLEAFLLIIIFIYFSSSHRVYISFYFQAYRDVVQFPVARVNLCLHFVIPSTGNLPHRRPSSVQINYSYTSSNFLGEEYQDAAGIR